MKRISLEEVLSLPFVKEISGSKKSVNGFVDGLIAYVLKIHNSAYKQGIIDGKKKSKIFSGKDFLNKIKKNNQKIK